MTNLKRLNYTVFDAGGPMLILVMLGIPIVLIILAIIVIFFTVRAIKRARAANDAKKAALDDIRDRDNTPNNN